MKTILYSLIVVFVVSIFAGNLNYGSQSYKTIVLQSLSDDVTDEMIAESASIISKRLKTYSTEKFKIRQIPGNQQIQISLSEAWNLDTVMLLTTQKGRLSFEEVYTVDEVKKEDQLLFNQLIQKLHSSEPNRPGAPLGRFNGSEAESIQKFINLSGLSSKYWFASSFAPADSDKFLYALHYPDMSDTSLSNSSIEYTGFVAAKSGMPYIQIQFSESAVPVWKMMTERNLNKSIAIVMDGTVLAAPVVKSVIDGGNCQITGDFSVNEAKYIAALVSSHELPINLYPIR